MTFWLNLENMIYFGNKIRKICDICWGLHYYLFIFGNSTSHKKTKTKTKTKRKVVEVGQIK